MRPMIRVKPKINASKQGVTPNIFKDGLVDKKDDAVTDGAVTPYMTDEMISDYEQATVSKLDLTFVTNNGMTDGGMTPVLGNNSSNNDNSHGADMSPMNSATLHHLQKTKVCKFWLRGDCDKDQKFCYYLHELLPEKIPKCP